MHFFVGENRKAGCYQVLFGIEAGTKYLGRDVSTISLALKRLESELAADNDRRVQMERLCTRIRQGRRRNYQISKA